MSKILFINPSKWGRGITPIWIASHASVLKTNGHNVELFDATFYQNWTDNEIRFNTDNKQYKPSEYESLISYNKNDVYDSLQKKIDEYNPDIIFWSAVSSHIHGEGEYVNIQYGYDLVSKVNTNSILVTGGIQATSNPGKILTEFNKIDFLIRGESEFVLKEIANIGKETTKISKINGVAYKDENMSLKLNNKQDIINDMDSIPQYDYSLFDDQIFLRPYNGKVIRGIDYEMSRGCVFTCSYCVETILQDYYTENKNVRGVLQSPKKYLRNKSAKRIFEEIKFLNEKFKIKLFRCQDTNFLTIKREVLVSLADLISNSDLDIMLYIETRPEGINDFTVDLLKKLKVDGVGMGIEIAAEGFREESLNRFASHSKIIKAFEILKKNNIKRTAYNIIGLPDQTEEMIKNTIDYNKMLKPDNVTVAYYSPYYGTEEQKKSYNVGDFDEYEKNVDGQIRSVSKSSKIPPTKLDYYKKNFSKLVYGLK